MPNSWGTKPWIHIGLKSWINITGWQYAILSLFKPSKPPDFPNLRKDKAISTSETSNRLGQDYVGIFNRSDIIEDYTLFKQSSNCVELIYELNWYEEKKFGKSAGNFFIIMTTVYVIYTEWFFFENSEFYLTQNLSILFRKYKSDNSSSNSWQFSDSQFIFVFTFNKSQSINNARYRFIT